jgi:putative FmdB family regulatory protein
MPLYEYRCQTCGHEFEKMVRFSEASQSPGCPKCSSVETAKKISMFASYGGSTTSSPAVSTASSCGGYGRFT